MYIINGKEISEEIKKDIKIEIEYLKKNENIVPGLAIILVGNNEASQIYVKNKKNACRNLGIHSEVIEFPENVSQIEILDTIRELNNDPKIHGILVQMPLPEHIDEMEIITAINPKKDVDGFHPVNVGRLTIGIPDFVPCTPQGVIELLNKTGIEIGGKECVIIGRSNIVGRPMATLMLQNNATVTICHSKTKAIEGIIKRADIIIIAIGKPRFLKGYMVKNGAVVIDVGMNRLDDGTLTGDVDFESVSKVAGYITPVPKGVGPMTIAMLMKNTVKAAIINNNPYINNRAHKLL